MADGDDKISNHGDNISNLGGNPSQHSDDNRSKKSKEEDLHTRSHAASTFINTSRQNWIATATARCNVLIGDLNEQYESAQELAEDQSLPSKKATIAKTELKDLELIKEEFCKTNSNLIEVVSSAKENPIEYEVSRMRFMTTYRKTRNIFLSMEPVPDESSASSSKSSNLKNLKLPKVDIPIFDGTFNNWTAFKNLFTSLVHNNNELDNEAKHHFLQTKVSGDAATMIVNLPTEEDNYEKAWSILLKHYDDPFRQIDAHFNALWNCQSSNKGSPTLKEQMVLFRQHTAGLQAIFRKNKIDGFSQSMQYWFLKKCDKGTHAEWQRELSRNKSFRSLDEFYDFMDNRSAAYQRTSANNDASANGSKTAVKRNHHGVAVVGAAATKSKYCVFCKSRQHYIPACPDYRNLSALDRFKFAKRSKLCFSCFRSDCRPSRCARQVCRKCQGAHNTLLHISPEEWATSAPPRQPNSTPAQQQAESTTPNQRSTEGELSISKPTGNFDKVSDVHDTCNSDIVTVANYLNIVKGNGLNVSSNSPRVILSTAIVLITSNFSKIPVRILLDQGSQFNFISRSILKDLKVRAEAVAVSVSGISANNTFVNQQVQVEIQSKHSGYREKIQCLVLDKITDQLPAQSFSIENWNIPPDIPLADPSFNLPGEIDMLLGGEIFWKVLGNKQIQLGKNLPTLRESKLGWLVTGSITISENAGRHCLSVSQQADEHLLDSLERFWSSENLERENLSAGETAAEKVFTDTTYRNKQGRFVVKLPFKDSPSLLGNSKHQAQNRFYSLEARFKKNPKFKERYVAAIEDFIKQGHMVEVTDHTVKGPEYYIPHHAVIKETSTSTKLRTVFDASMKTSNGVSLNDLLLVGPVVQLDLLSILFRFRMRRWVFVADIKQMYRQIIIDEKDTTFLRIFWRASEDEPLKVYVILVLLFGLAPAPFLATRCLKALGDEIRDLNSLVKAALYYDFYIDDALSGADSLHDALKLQADLMATLKAAGFELGKWCANHPDLLKNLPSDMIETQFPFQFEDKKTIKTLGLLWLPNEDTFKIWFHVQHPENAKTKRQVLSVIASIFDPIGFIGPVTVKAKLIMHEIWNSHKGSKGSSSWDDEIADDLKKIWIDFASQLNQLNEFSFPRYIFPLNEKHISLEIHGFCDASEKAYGAAVYVRSVTSSGSVTVHLFSAKSRINSKKQTIPRLELCGALLLSELVHKIKETLQISHQISIIRLWCDSTVVLGWLNSPAQRWHTYVANRVQKITDLTSDGIWDHVGTKTNPADLISRGTSPSELRNCDLWWKGPNWLHTSNVPWSKDINFVNGSESLPDLRKVQTIHSFITTANDLIFSKFSNYSKLIRVVGYMLRFVHQAHPYAPRIYGTLHLIELDIATKVLIKVTQQQYFGSEIVLLQSGRGSELRGPLYGLNPFLDDFGLIRVGGRLGNSDLSFEQQHPIVLSQHHHFTKLLVRHLHLIHLHAGPMLLKSIIRRRFWILKIHTAINNCILRCIRCIRQKAQVKTQLMSNLPRNRVVPSKPFSITGVDYAGPVLLTEWRSRSTVVHKAYIAVFVCFSTKAIHLELISDMTSDAFIAALERFVSRRGIPTEIHSDNGTTFTGANKLLQKLFQNEISTKLQTTAVNKGINWNFIPPYAPHFGGLWEAGVKSVKAHLNKVLNHEGVRLTFEQYNTVLAQIEACLNSRPLTPESSDPNDLNALTPGHFLIGGPITAIPNPDLTNVPDNRLKFWQKTQKLHQTFWQRWSAEYLNTLQQRTKWKSVKDELKVGMLVIIKEPEVPPTKWPLGRIKELHVGKDNHTRVVTLSTAKGEITRAISRIVLLPNDDKF